MRQAIIDIGTNTVKLLVADVQAGQLDVVTSQDQPTRLGEGVNATRRLAPAAIARTVQTVADYAATARQLGATDICAFTTSAVRDAENRDEFLAAVRDQTGLSVEVITGEREAELIFRGVVSDPVWSDQPLIVMDVGGGSAEFIQGRADRVEHRCSLPLGAVRLTEQFGEDRFPELCEHIRTTLHAGLTNYDPAGRQLIGTGGTITTLARIATGHADHIMLAVENLRALVFRLNALPLAERRQVPGLPPDRADIIVAGGMVFLLALESLHMQQLTVSTRNLRYGALLAP